MNDEALNVWKACLALTSSVGAAWMKFASSGVGYDDKAIQTAGIRGVFDIDPDICSRININRAHYREAADAMKQERYGITRAPDSPNVLVVDFGHLRFVRDVRASLYGDRRSPLSPDLRVKP